LTPKAAPKLVALRQQYGIKWCQAVLETWASERRREHASGKQHEAWMVSLPSLCRQLRAGSGPGCDLARWLLVDEWTRIVRQWGQLRTHPNPTVRLDAVCDMGKPILALLESSLIANSPDLHSEILRILNPSALIGVSHVASGPDWQQSARRLVDILITGSRPIK
jgi:hypothetical protein